MPKFIDNTIKNAIKYDYDGYYLDIEIDGYQVQTRFIEFTNTMLLTDNITCSVISSAFSRHFINFHDITSKNDVMFKYRMDKIVDILEIKD